MRISLSWSAPLITLLAAASLTIAAAPAGVKPSDKSAGKFGDIERAVSQYLGEQPDLKPTDLVTQDDVAPLLAQLQQKKLLPVDAKKILAKVPSQGEFFVEQLRSPAGRKFMRRISELPGAYDRLDRLSRLPHGKQTINDLVRGPGGDEMIKYMTTTAGGQAMGKQLSKARDGAGFNEPTGRIYTVAMLLDFLRQSDAAGAKPAPGRR